MYIMRNMMLLPMLAVGCTSAPAANTLSVPIIDVSVLLCAGADASARRDCISAIREACIEVGFFYVSNHGVSESLQDQLDESFRHFVAQPREVKRKIEMAKAGSRWRGYFEVGEEHTCMVVDQKEGLYFAAERPDDNRPLHGANLFPSEADAPGLKDAVLEYMKAMKPLANTLLMAIGEAIGLPHGAFAAQFADPTTLFRCFHYPPHSEDFGPDSFPVGEHTDMGFLTVLKQDGSGGLQVKSAADESTWIDVPPVPNTFVVNLGDCLERCTGGLLRATPHRVTKRLGEGIGGRCSYPFFFDPTFDARMVSYRHLLPPELQARAEARRRRGLGKRFDGRDLEMYDGPYGDWAISKVKNVFPALAKLTEIRTEGADPTPAGAY